MGKMKASLLDTHIGSIESFGVPDVEVLGHGFRSEEGKRTHHVFEIRVYDVDNIPHKKELSIPVFIMADILEAYLLEIEKTGNLQWR